MFRNVNSDEFINLSSYDERKAYFEALYYQTVYNGGTVFMVERANVRWPHDSVNTRSVNKFVVEWQQMWRSRDSKHCRPFIHKWLLDPCAVSGPDLDTMRVAKFAWVPSFGELMPFITVKDTVSFQAVMLAYDIATLRQLLWRVAADFIFPNFRKNSKVYRAIMAAHGLVTIRGTCDTVICDAIPRSQNQIDIQSVLKSPILSKIMVAGAPGSMRPEGRVGVTQMFYDGVCHNAVRGCYNPHHQRSRPLPNRLSLVAQEYLMPLLDRYEKLIPRVKRFVSSNIPTFIRCDEKRLNRMDKEIHCLRGAIKVLRSQCARKKEQAI